MKNSQKTVLLVGMARSGIAAAKLLHEMGYRIIINDMKSEIPGLLDALLGVEYINGLGKNPEELFHLGIDLMVLSPVVPIFAPFCDKARARGIEVIGEIELAYRFTDRDVPYVCISGTNGKTTTTSLTGALFMAQGIKTHVLGNIGIPISEQAKKVKKGEVIVAETAALQLESIVEFRPNAFGMLNITEDHLNRFQYKMENYIKAKCRGFENQRPEDFAILNYDDETVRNMASLTNAKVLYFSQTTELSEGISLIDGMITYRLGEIEHKLVHVSKLKIPGKHNIENALCATGLALCMGVSPEAVRCGLQRFGGVEHRLESVRELCGVEFINDSKATNPDSSIKAVEAMTKPVVLLLGVGEYDKKSDFLPLFQAFKGKVTHVICSGSNAKSIMEAAKKANFTAVEEHIGSFSEMVKRARFLAKPGEAVLLSPAAASWGQFSDFEERGRIFKEIVNNL